MSTKRLVLVAGLSLALVAALGAGVLVGGLAVNNAFAQGPTGFGPGMMGGRFANGQNDTTTAPYAGGMMGGARGLGYSEVMLPTLAKSLGMSVEDLQAQLKGGKTVADLAKEKNVSLEKLAADMIAAHKDYLAGLVKDGKITQQQADWMIQRMEQVESHPCLTGQVTPGTAPTQGFGGRGGMMGGRGGMMGAWGSQGTSN